MSIILENHFDPNYDPSVEEIEDYGKWLGMTFPEDNDLLYIAKEGLKAPLPEHWNACKSEKGDLYYFNFKTGKSIWDHPLDDHYKKLFESKKQQMKATEVAVITDDGGNVIAPSKESKDDGPKKSHKSKKRINSDQENCRKDVVSESTTSIDKDSTDSDCKQPIEKSSATHLSTLKALKLRNTPESNVTSNVVSATSECLVTKTDENASTGSDIAPCTNVSRNSVKPPKSLSSIVKGSRHNTIPLKDTPFTTPSGGKTISIKVEEHSSIEAKEAVIRNSVEEQIINEKKDTDDSVTKSLTDYKAERMQWLNREKEKCREEAARNLENLKADLSAQLECEIKEHHESNTLILRKLKEELHESNQNEIDEVRRSNDDEMSKLIETNKKILLDAKSEYETTTKNEITQLQNESIERWWKAEIKSYGVLLEEFSEMHAAILLKNRLNHQSRILQVAKDLEIKERAINFDQIDEEFNLMKEEMTARHEVELYEKKVYHENMVCAMEENLKIVEASRKALVNRVIHEGEVAAAMLEVAHKSNRDRRVSPVVPDVILAPCPQKLQLPWPQIAKEDLNEVCSLVCTDISDENLLSASPSVDLGDFPISGYSAQNPLGRVDRLGMVDGECPVSRESTPHLTADNIRSVVADTLKEIFLKQKNDMGNIGEQCVPSTTSNAVKKSHSTLDMTLPTSFKEQKGMIEEERHRLYQAKKFIEAQRVEIEERRANLKTARRQWKRDVLKAKDAGVRGNSQKGQLLRNVHEVLDKQALGLEHDERVVRESEHWLGVKSARLGKLSEQLESIDPKRGVSSENLIHDFDTSLASVDTAALVVDYFRNESLLCGVNHQNTGPSNSGSLSHTVSQQPLPQQKNGNDEIVSKKLSKALRHIEKRLDKFANVILDNQINIQRQRTEEALSAIQSQKLVVPSGSSGHTNGVLREPTRVFSALNTNKFYGDWGSDAAGRKSMSVTNMRPNHDDHYSEKMFHSVAFAEMTNKNSTKRALDGDHHIYRKTRTMSNTKGDKNLRKRVCIDSNPVTFY